MVPVVPATERSYASALTLPALTAVSVAASVPSVWLTRRLSPPEWTTRTRSTVGLKSTDHVPPAGNEVENGVVPICVAAPVDGLIAYTRAFGAGDADADQLSSRRADIEADDPLAGRQTGDGNGGRDGAGGRRVEPDELAHPGQPDQRCGRGGGAGRSHRAPHAGCKSERAHGDGADRQS